MSMQDRVDNREFQNNPRVCWKTAKLRFPTQLDAIHVLRNAEKNGADGTHGQRSYVCKYCGAWHLGHVEEYQEPTKVAQRFRFR